MSRADGVLHLVLCERPWWAIAAGYKPVEYRDPTKPKWQHLIEDIQSGVFRSVCLQRGFRQVNGAVPTMLFLIDRADLGPVDLRWIYGILPSDRPMVRIWLGEHFEKQAVPRRSGNQEKGTP